MDIPGPAPQPALTLTPIPAATPKWQPGQSLIATVSAILGPDRVALQIGNTRIEAATTGTLPVGQRLALQVARVNDQIVLRVAAAVSDTQIETGALRPSPAPRYTLTAPTAAAAWRVGQQLQAVVTAVKAQRVTLQIGAVLYEAHSSEPAAGGQRLTLQVVETGRHTVLKTVAESDSAALQAALRATLPRQIPLQQLFVRMGAALAGSGTPPAVAALLKQVLQNLPEADSVTRGDGFRQALLDSGQFLEQRLHGDAPPQQLRRDLKANLLRLLAELLQHQDGGKDLTRQVDGAVARIQLHQLAALAPEQAAAWTGELPLRRGDQVDVCRLRIEKDGGGTGDGEPGWSTWLSLDLKALGPLHARLRLSRDSLSTTLWAESSATAALVNEHLDHLRSALRGAGLEVKELQCRQGRPPFMPPDRLPTGLLDITA